MWRDIRAALRNFSKYPALSIVALLSLAAGIGATTATLTLRNAVFCNPPPLYRDPAELSVVGILVPDRPHRQPVPVELYAGWFNVGGLYSAIAAAGSARSTDVRTPDVSTTIMVRPVTAGLFPLLGVAPALGRAFSPADPKAGEASAAVLSHQAWQRLFGGSPDVLGTTLWIEDRPHTVIGVMPRRFWFGLMDPTVWTPFNPAVARPVEGLEVVVRRMPGVGSDALGDAFRGSLDRYAATLPVNERALRLQVSGIGGTPAGRDIGPLVVWLLEACVLITLLISCTNVAVLTIAQWTGRERDIAMHAALGAGRARVLRSLLTESVLLAALGGASGLFLAFALFRESVHHGPPETELLNLSMDFGVLLRTAAVTCLAAILTGVGPAILKTRNLHANPLRLITSDRVGQRWRHALVVFEIGVTTVLLIVTSILFDGYRRALSSYQGFDRQPLVVARIEAPGGVESLQMCERLGFLAGASGAAAATAVPTIGRGAWQTFSADAGGSAGVGVEKVFVTSNFFAVLGVPIRTGRGFSSRDDRAGGTPSVVINESLAKRISPGRNPVGTRLWNSGTSYDVVGVVADYLWIPLARPSPAAYLPFSQKTASAERMQFVVKAAGNSSGLVQAVRAGVRRFRSDHVVSAFTMQSVVEAIGGEILTVVYPMAILMGVAVLLSATGIYAILAFAIARRSKEIAVRMAVGATRNHVFGLVSGLSLRLLGIGVAIGTMLMFGLSRFAQGSGSVFDSRTSAVFIVPIVALFVVGALATWMPARRATTVNPAELLRSQ